MLRVATSGSLFGRALAPKTPNGHRLGKRAISLPKNSPPPPPAPKENPISHEELGRSLESMSRSGNSSALESLKSFTDKELAQMARHGQGDGVISLNVGGKEFLTLRSTVYLNPVLREHVVRAELNNEFTQGGKSVFIDRDPTHFPLILQHLRNVAAGIEYGSSGSAMMQKAKSMMGKDNYPLVQLPSGRTQLKELYIEATHYDIVELKKMICVNNLYINAATTIGGGAKGNPFQTMSNLIRNLRNGTLTLGTLGFAAGSQHDDFNEFFSNVKKQLVGDEPKPKAA